MRLHLAAPSLLARPLLAPLGLALCLAAALPACKKEAPPDATPIETQAAEGPAAPSGPSVVPDLPPGATAAQLPPGHPPTGELPPGHPPIEGQAAGQPPAAAPVEVGTVAKADKDIAEVRANKATLGGQSFAVRGRVVKVNTGIMNRNWVHLRDNSAEQALVVTTQGKPAVGDLVLARGKLGVDRDMGAGYVYDVLLEDSEITVESGAAAAPAAGTAPANAPATAPAPANAPADAPPPANAPATAPAPANAPANAPAPHPHP